VEQNTGQNAESLFYRGAGPLAAILLGILLIPLRGVTTASNLAFAFMALTIVVSELGGRWAAIATALVSALSLDFFLTQPYLKLAIDDKHDIIAFVGLAACGLIAASLGAHRGERIAALTTVRKHRDLLHSILSEWDRGAPGEAQLEKILGAARAVLPLSAAVVRDGRGRVVASSGGRAGMLAVPEDILQPDTLVPANPSTETAQWGLALPANGGRIALVSGTRPLGWLDIWGNGVDAGVESRRAISDVARLVGVVLVSAPTPPGEQPGS
jgi:uncharacterized protein DUF4118